MLKIIELLLVLYNCMLIFLACQLGALVNHTSRLEWDILVINLTNLKRNSNQYCINIIVSSTFFQANQSANTRFHRICFTGIWLHTIAQEHAARSCGPGQVLDWLWSQFSTSGENKQHKIFGNSRVILLLLIVIRKGQKNCALHSA